MILEIKKGCFGYPKQDIILHDINLSLEEGHILAILGPNGIGKTTLLKCMIGLLPWREGTTYLYGQDIKTLKPKELWSNVSYIPQSHGFAFSYTGLEMVMLGRCPHLGVLNSPADGAENVDLPATLSWSPAKNASKYTVKLLRMRILRMLYLSSLSSIQK